MKLCVIGAGYVGLVTAACFANLGNEVIGVEKDRKKLKILKRGRAPFYEPGLSALIQRNLSARRLKFAGQLAAGLAGAEVVFIAVGTPAKANGEADIKAVVEVAEQIAPFLAATQSQGSFRVLVNKSTVPVGVGDIVTKILKDRGVPEQEFSVVSNPEFLREGSAIADFLNPDRIVIGADNNRAFSLITELYRPLNAHIIFTSVKTAELIKYASNAFLATKVSFINEIANICERTGADVSEVAAAMGLDKRIGREFLNAGIGYGGSCLPKDVSALISLAESKHYRPLVLKSVQALNRRQVAAFAAKILAKLKPLKNKKIAVLGVTFKPETDDLREAPALALIRILRTKGAVLSLADPALKTTRVLGQRVYSDVYAAVRGAAALVVLTEWPEYRELDFKRVKRQMRGAYIFDGRNIYDKAKLAEQGFVYYGVGR